MDVDRFLWTMMGYGMEIWGWREREGIEKMEERYMRWVMGLGRESPGYLLREELQREKLRGRAERGARRFEEKGEGRGEWFGEIRGEGGEDWFERGEQIDREKQRERKNGRG